MTVVDDAAWELFAAHIAQATQALEHIVNHEALAGLMVAFYARIMANNRAQAARDVVVLENFAQGLCLFDSDQRLVMSKRQYAET